MHMRIVIYTKYISFSFLFEFTEIHELLHCSNLYKEKIN